jgi:hypothetical protein
VDEKENIVLCGVPGYNGKAQFVGGKVINFLTYVASEMINVSRSCISKISNLFPGTNCDFPERRRQNPGFCRTSGKQVEGNFDEAARIWAFAAHRRSKLKANFDEAYKIQAFAAHRKNKS